MNIPTYTPSFWARSRHFVTLVLFKALATLRSERQRTYLGFLWWFFEPLLLMLVFYIVFDVLMHRGGPDFIAVLISGIVLWQWFGKSIMNCATSVQAGLPLMRTVRVEPAVFPLATLLSDCVKFTLVLAVLIVVLMALGHPPHWSWFALVPVLIVEFLLTCGCCMIVSSLVPFMPDLRFVISPLIQGMFFLSGVFFTMDSLSPQAQEYLELNPMAVLIDSGRKILLYGHVPSMERLAVVLVEALVVLTVGIVLLRNFSSRYAKLAD